MRKTLLLICTILELVFLVGTLGPPLPESPRLAQLAMKESQDPLGGHTEQLEKERTRLKRQQDFLRFAFAVGFVTNGFFLIRLGRRRS